MIGCQHNFISFFDKQMDEFDDEFDVDQFDVNLDNFLEDDNHEAAFAGAEDNEPAATNKDLLFGEAFGQFLPASQSDIVMPTQLVSSNSSTTQAPAPARSNPPAATSSLSASASANSHILVHSNQRGNPILSFIKNVPWAYSHQVTLCDYQVKKKLNSEGTSF